MYPKIGAVHGYPEYQELDAVIQFWLNYWKEFGLPYPKDIGPLIEIVLVRLYNEIGPSMHMRVFLRKKGIALWDVTYNGEFDTLRTDAHFHPLYEEEFSSDLDSDSYPEIAIAVWHGGHAMELCRAVIFTVKDDRLIPLKTRQNNYEFSRSVFKNKVQAESEFKLK